MNRRTQETAKPIGSSIGTNLGKSKARKPAVNATQRRFRLSLTAARYMRVIKKSFRSTRYLAPAEEGQSLIGVNCSTG